jgi:hypothetical protein
MSSYKRSVQRVVVSREFIGRPNVHKIATSITCVPFGVSYKVGPRELSEQNDGKASAELFYVDDINMHSTIV